MTDFHQEGIITTLHALYEGLDRHEEELTARYFRGFLWTAWKQSKGPHESVLIPSWNRVAYSLPDIYVRLRQAVAADNT